MTKTVIIGIGIAAAVVVAVLTLVISSDVEPITQPEIVPQIQEQILSDGPVSVVDFTAVQYGDEITLTMTIGGEMPQTIDEISLSESAIGFGYGWFGVSGTGGGHEEGGGHLRGYTINIFSSEDESGWEAKPAAWTVFKTSYMDGCMGMGRPPADFSVEQNKITLTNEPDTRPYLNANFIDRIVSFEIRPESKFCHQNQYAIKIIDIEMPE